MPDDIEMKAAGTPQGADEINPFSEQVSQILEGAIDLHCHSGPSVMPRNINHIEEMHDAAANGLRAVLVKDHYYSATPVTQLLNEHYHHLPVRMFSGVPLNNTSGGFNIYAIEVEAALASHPAVMMSAVVGIPHPEWGEAVHAEVLLRPGASVEVDREYRERSPIFFLQNAVELPLDICAGVKDGKTGSVPIHHSLRAFNVVAEAGGHATIPAATMDELWGQGRLTSPQPEDEVEDPTYERAILLRRQAGKARVTIFDGGHEALPAAACDWLARQSRPTGRGSASNRPNR